METLRLPTPHLALAKKKGRCACSRLASSSPATFADLPYLYETMT